MKKRFLLLILLPVLLCLLFMQAAAGEETGEEVPVQVQRVAVNYKNLRLHPGEASVTLVATVLPEDADCTTVHWLSSDENVVTVDENGLVTAVAAGKANVIAVSDADPSKKAVTTVTVLQPVTAIKIESVPDELPKGQNVRLSATVEPADASNRKVVWESSDRSVVYILNGVLVTRGSGVAVLSCYAEDGCGAGDAVIVEVYEPVESVKIVDAPDTVYTGTEVPLTASVKPADAKYKQVTWSVSDERLAAVDENGVLTPLKAGNVTVIAEAEGKKAKKQLKIVKPVTSLTLNEKSGELEKGEKIRLQATVEPSDATNTRVLWSSSDPKVASVQNGTVTARKGGTAVITATAPGGEGMEAAYLLRVREPAKDVRFSEKQIAVAVGHTVAPELTLTPVSANELELTWKISDSSVASIEEEIGRVTGIKPGLCNLTVSDAVSGKTSSIKVLVEPEIPVSVQKFTRSGGHSAYNEFSLQIKNLQAVRSVTGIRFTIVYDCAGELRSREFEIKVNPLPPNKEMKAGPFEIGYQLTYTKAHSIYLNAVSYSDGTVTEFENVLLGTFE